MKLLKSIFFFFKMGTGARVFLWISYGRYVEEGVSDSVSLEEGGRYGSLYNGVVSPTFLRRCLAAGGSGAWPDESESGRTFFCGAGFGPFQILVFLYTCLLVTTSEFWIFCVRISFPGGGRDGYKFSLCSCKISKSL